MISMTWWSPWPTRADRHVMLIIDFMVTRAQWPFQTPQNGHQALMTMNPFLTSHTRPNRNRARDAS
jgi:hypothetical protein